MGAGQHRPSVSSPRDERAVPAASETAPSGVALSGFAARGAVWSRTAQLSCAGCPPSIPLAGPSRWVTHSLGHLPASPLLSLGLLGGSQALGLCQVVHSDGQEDVEQDVWGTAKELRRRAEQDLPAPLLRAPPFLGLTPPRCH